MLGRTFAPLFDPSQRQPQGGPQGQDGAQQAIQTLTTRLPRVVGAGAPAPQALLTSPGSGGLPSENISPVIQAILQAVLGHFSPQQQSAASAQGGMMPQSLIPNVKYQYPGPGPGTPPPPGGDSGAEPPPPQPAPEPLPRYGQPGDTREDRQTRQGKQGTDNYRY